MAEVFNTYNVNILFTVAALPARVALGLPPGGPGMLLAPGGAGQPSMNVGGGMPQIQQKQ